MKNWQKKEKSDAKLFEGRRMPRSGGLWFCKGDSKSKKFLIEDKTSQHEGFTVTTKLWEKISREALLSQRIPIVSAEFGDKKLELVVLDKNDFVSLMEEKNGID